MLQQMQDANIRDTITGLTGFANRYYTSAPGIAASDWLKDKFARIAAAYAVELGSEGAAAGRK